MSTSNNQIFALNPLSLVFLSGFITQLFISLCCIDPNTGYTENNVVKKNTDIRMNKWQICFYTICKKLFNDSSSIVTDEEEDEAAIVTETESNVFGNTERFNPYLVHSTLLIIYSTAILNSVTNSTLGPKTLTKVDEWFESIIASVFNSDLWSQFTIENKNQLRTLIIQHSNMKKQYKTTNDDDEYAHFSPRLLFIRSMSLIIIHQTECMTEFFTEWARLNAFLVKDLFKIDSYTNELHDSTKTKEFSNFPYIHVLDVEKLFLSWDRDAQKSKCVPVCNIYLQIVVQIKTKTEKYLFNQLRQGVSCLDDDDESYQSFIQILIDVEEKIKKLEGKMSNCEKQSKYYSKKRQKKTSGNVEGEKWTCPFIFPLDVIPEEDPLDDIPEEDCYAN
jgi:hypothetical protein